MDIENLTIILSDPQVLSSLITAVIGAVVSIITSVFTWLAGRQGRETRRELRKEHLLNFYEPLDEILSSSKYSFAEVKRNDVCTLLAKQYRYATPRVKNQINDLKNIKNITEDDFLELKKTVSALYNWHCKILGFSFDRKAIKRIYIPGSLRHNFHIFDAVTAIFLLCSISLTFFAMGYAFLQLWIIIKNLTFLMIVVPIVFLIAKSLLTGNND